MTAETNKEVALSWFEALVTGDAERALGMLDDDFRYYLPGNMPCSGWSDRDGFLATVELLGRFTAGPTTMRFGAVTAEDDRVLIEAESTIPLTGGALYTNAYILAMRVRDGKIAEFKEFSDTLHVYQSFDTPEVRGAPKERESHIGQVTQTITSPAAQPVAG